MVPGPHSMIQLDSNSLWFEDPLVMVTCATPDVLAPCGHIGDSRAIVHGARQAEAHWEDSEIAESSRSQKRETRLLWGSHTTACRRSAEKVQVSNNGVMSLCRRALDSFYQSLSSHRIIQMYMMREETGTLSSDDMDRNKVTFPKL